MMQQMQNSNPIVNMMNQFMMNQSMNQSMMGNNNFPMGGINPMIAQMMMMQHFFNMNQQNNSNMSNMQANMKLMENQTKMRDLMKSMDDSSRKMGKNQQSGSQGSRTESSPNSSSI